MNHFLIAATDIHTGATVYGRLSASGNDLNFRQGVGISGTQAGIEGMFMHRSNGTPLDADVACGLLAMHTRRIAGMREPWVRDLRLVLA